MRKILSILFISILFPSIALASGNYAKSSACGLKDGIYKKNLQVNYPGATTVVRNLVKSGTSLFYIVNASEISTNKDTQELYSYNCKSKKATLLSDLTLSVGGDISAEIDFFNKDYIFIQYIGDYLDGEGPAGEKVLYRSDNSVKEFKLANQDALVSQYVQDFGIINDLPYQVKDITSQKDGNLLVWITWGSHNGSMLRALSVNQNTFYASNVLYDYTFKQADNTDAWLKIKGKKLYEKSNANEWVEIKNVDLKSFRAIQANYGRDKNGYTTYQASQNLPQDVISEGYHLWYAPLEKKIYSYNNGQYTSLSVNHENIFFHDLIGFDSPNAECTNTTGSYGYVAQDSSFCYGNIGGSNADFGVVGKVK